jgi:hypothetical protein
MSQLARGKALKDSLIPKTGVDIVILMLPPGIVSLVSWVNMNFNLNLITPPTLQI